MSTTVSAPAGAADATDVRVISHWIDGAERVSTSGRTAPVYNPATGAVSARVALADQAEIDEAIASAQRGYEIWKDYSIAKRQTVLFAFRELLNARKGELARIITAEHGKVVSDAIGEILRGQEVVELATGFPHLIKGAYSENVSTGIDVYSLRQPLGVVGIISPFNFPLYLAMRAVAPAIALGNAVVLKPAGIAPALSLELARVLHEAGLPKGVLNVIVGEGRAVGGAIVTHKSVAALSFTGSYAVGNAIYQQLAQRMARAQMEMGGKNPTLVLADADLDLAATLVARAGFGLTGQACTATSRVIVEKPVLAAFTEKLVARARAWKVGPGHAQGVEMGAVVSETQLKGNLEWLKIAVDGGAQLLCGGNRLSSGDFAHGWFMEPTVLGGVTPTMRVACEEVFGPVVAVLAAENFDDALRIANGVEVGLSASLVTRDYKNALRYAEVASEAGVVKVNQISTGLALQAPFGGVKQSSTDSFKEQGVEALDFYTRIKTVYLDYSA